MVDKYSNLEETLPQLQRVLRQSIQSEFLEIQKLDTACMKFKTVLEKKPELEKGVYVVFSRFIKRGFVCTNSPIKLKVIVFIPIEMLFQ